MKDHARRFRLRAMMADGIKASPRSVGDLVGYLDDLLEDDETLSRALVPEVWQVARRESGGGGRHQQERRKFLRFQVLREVALSSRQALGLEPWGRMKVEYAGLDTSLPWIQEHAHSLGISPDDLRRSPPSVNGASLPTATENAVGELPGRSASTPTWWRTRSRFPPVTTRRPRIAFWRRCASEPPECLICTWMTSRYS